MTIFSEAGLDNFPAGNRQADAGSEALAKARTLTAPFFRQTAALAVCVTLSYQVRLACHPNATGVRVIPAPPLRARMETLTNRK